MPYETRTNITRLALSPNGELLVTIDETNSLVLAHFHRILSYYVILIDSRVILSGMNLKEKVFDIKFAPNGLYFAVTVGKTIEVWKSPGLHKEYAPFSLYRTFSGHTDLVTHIYWTADSEHFLTCGRSCYLSWHYFSDNLSRHVYVLSYDVSMTGWPITALRMVLSGHKERVVAAYTSSSKDRIISIGKDGAIFIWIPTVSSTGKSSYWTVEKKVFCNQKGHVVTTQFHENLNLLVVGFSTGMFAAYELPEGLELMKLSISSGKVRAIAINPTGEWMAFGVPAHGQLLVWEWQSERYVLKQQGHFFRMNCLSYSPHGRYIATGGQDAKLKLWNTDTGFCFITFTDHKSTITGVTFGPVNKQILVTCSLDGTVRAFDLIRYRNFRVLTSPDPRQFSCVTLDSSGEIVAAGCTSSFEVYVWDLQTGKVLDMLDAHEGPVSCIAFNPNPHTDSLLATGSWDHTVKLWDVFAGNKVAKDTLTHNADVLALAWSPDGKLLAVSTLDGRITLWDPHAAQQLGVIDGRFDLASGRETGGAREAKTAVKGTAFFSLAFNAAGDCILAGGNSRFVCLYEVKNRILIKKFQVSHNRSLDGVIDYLDNRKVHETAGDVDLIDDMDDIMEEEQDRRNKWLPGVQSGFYSDKRKKLKVGVSQLIFAPSGRQWACTSTMGLLMFTLDSDLLFDPYMLDMDITSENVIATCKRGEYFKALIMALRLNEHPISVTVFESIPPSEIRLIVTQLHSNYIPRLLTFISLYLSGVQGKGGQSVTISASNNPRC